MKYKLKYYSNNDKCPACSNNTLVITTNGDSCTNCGYYVYYG